MGNWGKILTLLAVWVGSAFGSARAEEPIRDFLQALRMRGFYDLADIYLEEMSTSPLADSAFRERIPLERAENLIQSLPTTRNTNLRLERIAKAEGILSEFTAKASSNSELITSANETLANLKFFKARSFLTLAESDRVTQDEKDEKQAAARKLFLECIELYDKVRLSMKTELEKLTEAAKQNPRYAGELRQRRETYTQILLKSPQIKLYSAQTLPLADPSRRQLLEAAVAEFDGLADDYSQYGISIDAVLNAASCLNLMGNPEEGIKRLERIFRLDNVPQFRLTRKAAAMVGLEVWPKLSPYPYAKVIDALDPMVASLTKAEQREEDWAKIQLELGLAYHHKADAARESGSATGSDINRWKSQAAVLAKRAARSRGDVRDQARRILSEWNISFNDNDVEVAEAATFSEAKENALDAAIELDSKNTEVTRLTQVLAAAKPDEKGPVETQLNEARKELNQAARATLLSIEQAMRLGGSELGPEDQNHLRYLQAYAYYVQDRLHEPTVIGEFLLHHRPTVEWTRQAAGLAVRSYAKMYEAAPAEQRQHERQKLIELSERIVRIWSGTPEADQAAMVMVRMGMLENDEAMVKKYSTRLSQASGARDAVGLRLTQNKWFDYKKSKRAMSSDEQNARADELREQVAEFVRDFQAGLSEVTRDNATFDNCYAAVSLVDALLELGEVEKAVQQLEDAEIAPLDFIKQKHPAIFDSPNARIFQQSTYRSAINVYLASLSKGTDSQQWITKTQGVINALNQVLAESDAQDASRQMAAIYGLIANELTEQFARMKDDAEKRNLAYNLSLFLESLANSAADSRTLIWAANTMLDTADSLAGRAKPSDTAIEIYRKAAQTYERALASDLTQLDQPANDVRLELKHRRALALAGIGSYEDSIKLFADILAETSSLRIQMSAARTLTNWGKFANRSRALEEAMMGAMPKTDEKTKRKTNLIWGWRAIYSQLRGKDQFISQFHEATLGLVESQIEYGLAFDRKEAIEAARKELSNSRTRDPELGGPQFKSRYEELERRLPAASK
jgi:hypothetical protein